jgi:hypothetical protein
MFDFSLRHDGDQTMLALTGVIEDEADLERLGETFALVPAGDDLLLSVSGVRAISSDGATALHELLAARASRAFVVVVSTCEAVSMELVLHDIDRLCPIVPTAGDALEILDARWARM